MNALALGYFSNPSLVKGKEDLELMEKAYATKKTIKSTHNLAWYYYIDCWGSLEKALGLQKECISMQPKSFYPYFLYGYMLLANNQSVEAIENLEIAHSKHKSREIIHNLGTAYAKSGNFEIAKKYLVEVANKEDIEKISKYNLALVQIKLKQKKEALTIAEEFRQMIVDNSFRFGDIDSFEVAYLYYLLEDYHSAYACCKTCDYNYDLLSWEYVPYLIYKNDIDEFQKLVASEIEEKTNWIIENKDNKEFWEDDTEEEKQEYLAERKSEIIRLTNLEAEFALNKPNIDVNNLYFLESCGCLLFGCSEHNYLKDDE